MLETDIKWKTDGTEIELVADHFKCHGWCQSISQDRSESKIGTKHGHI